MSHTTLHFLLAVAAVVTFFDPASAQSTDPATLLYVNSFVVSQRHIGTGVRSVPVAYVTIVDGYSRRVKRALIVGNWSGCFKQNNDSAVTETFCWTDEFGEIHCEDGVAVILANKASNCWGKGKSCSFTFTITSVSKAGMMYVPVAGKTTASTPCF